MPMQAVLAQSAPAAPVAKPKPSAPVPAASAADYAPDAKETAPVAPPPLPPAMWDPVSVQDLIFYIRQVGGEGLDPAFYDAAGLEAALKTGNPALYSPAATERFNKLSSDLALGHIKKNARVDWWIVDKDLDAASQDALLRNALASHSMTATLNGLLPSHPQYGLLKNALMVTPASDTAKRDRIMLNMDRWRWLPKDLGNKYIIVNVPGFHATLVENGVNRWKERAIAGKLSTPTPQLSAIATGVMLNPPWNVPSSIAHEAAGKKGFKAITGDGGKVLYWQQPPGPNNALGQMKFIMPNSKAIYLHDTNARSRFNSDVRALSHGCIRTKNIHDLAATLGSDDGGEWTREKIDATLATNKTVTAKFVNPLPVYIVYFSAAALNDGKVVDYSDLYKRDPKALAAMKMKDGGASLAKPKENKVASN
jgi:murein L,D-transpeptidase YcbB/YkuD